MYPSAVAAVSASAAMRSRGSVPEKRQMTQLPSENQSLTPSERSTRVTSSKEGTSPSSNRMCCSSFFRAWLMPKSASR